MNILSSEIIIHVFLSCHMFNLKDLIQYSITISTTGTKIPSLMYGLRITSHTVLTSMRIFFFFFIAGDVSGGIRPFAMAATSS